MAFTKIVGSGIKDDTKVTVGVITASEGVKGLVYFQVEQQYIVALSHHLTS